MAGHPLQVQLLSRHTHIKFPNLIPSGDQALVLAGDWGSGVRPGEGTKEVREATGTHYGWEHKPEEMEYLFIKGTKVHYGYIDLHYNPQRETIFKALNPTQIQFYM